MQPTVTSPDLQAVKVGRGTCVLEVVCVWTQVHACPCVAGVTVCMCDGGRNREGRERREEKIEREEKWRDTTTQIQDLHLLALKDGVGLREEREGDGRRKGSDRERGKEGGGSLTWYEHMRDLPLSSTLPSAQGTKTILQHVHKHYKESALSGPSMHTINKF